MVPPINIKLHFPVEIVISQPSRQPPAASRIDSLREVAAVKVKHTHPPYADTAERMERLRDLLRSCRALLHPERKEQQAK